MQRPTTLQALLISITSVLLTACGPDTAVLSDSDDAFDTVEGRIVGGTDADIAAVPWQVAVMDASGSSTAAGRSSRRRGCSPRRTAR